MKYIGGPLLILAGAGSGKTRVLTHKIAWLISEGIADPEDILAVTFTNKAAGEMRTRINDLVGSSSAAKRISVSTFHGYGLRFLFRHAQAAEKMLGLREGFTVFDRDDSRALLKDILDELEEGDKKLPEEKSPAQLLDIISKDYVTWSPFKHEKFINDEWIMSIADEYRSRLRKLNAVDFDDLMMLPLMMMENDSRITKAEQDRIRWLLVDEYQDVNNAQALLLRRYLVGTDCIINAVGDPDQAIYGWRGADINVILNFTKEYPKAKMIKLEQNYRSTKMILDASNALIRMNINRLKKELHTANKTGDKIQTVFASDDYQETDFVVREVARLHDLRNYKYSDIVVLYRQNSMSRLLEKTFLREKIPCRIIRGVSFYERMEVKDVLSILKLALNPADTVSVERVAKIKTVLEGMGAKTLVSWGEWLDSQPMGAFNNPAQLWSSVAMGAWKPSTKKAADSIKKFAAHMCEILEISDEGIKEVVDYVLYDMGYAGHLMKYDPQTCNDRLGNVNELKSIVPDGDLRETLAEATLFTDADTVKDDTDAVGLMTLHAAKGLEFPVVFIIGLEEGVFPILARKDSEDPEAELEEERRLCYVGMTRAEERLYMSMASSRMIYGSRKENDMSRFLMEIPDSLKKVEERGLRTSVYDHRDSGRRGYGGYSSYGRNRLW